MLAEVLALTTCSATPEIVSFQKLDPNADLYEFEQANTDLSAGNLVSPKSPPWAGSQVAADLSPEAFQQVVRIVRAVEFTAPAAEYHIDTADDGSLLLEVADETTGREILFAISPKSAKVYFSTSETPSLNGIVTLQRGLESLLQWVAGAGQISKESLLLPSK
jgi:hypothetical protein